MNIHAQPTRTLPQAGSLHSARTMGQHLSMPATSAITFKAQTAPTPLLSRREGPVQYLQIQDPDHQNRLTREVIQALHKALIKAENDPNVTHIVIESGMDKYFSPGADLFSDMKRVQSMQEKLKARFPRLSKKVLNGLAFLRILPSVRKYALDGHHMFQQLANSQKVTVAKVNGYALGGGMEIALACDYTVAGNKAQFVLPETKYGIYPDWGGTERLPARVGRTMATFLIMEGGLMPDKGIQCRATLNATEAQQLGLVHTVLPSEGFETTANQIINSPAFQTKAKRAKTTQEVDSLDATMRQQIANTRFAPIYDRYKSASMADLKANELKSLYPKTVDLTQSRIDKAPHMSTYRLHRDLVKMLYYFGQVMGRKSPQS